MFEQSDLDFVVHCVVKCSHTSANGFFETISHLAPLVECHQVRIYQWDWAPSTHKRPAPYPGRAATCTLSRDNHPDTAGASGFTLSEFSILSHAPSSHMPSAILDYPCTEKHNPKSDGALPHSYKVLPGHLISISHKSTPQDAHTSSLMMDFEHSTQHLSCRTTGILTSLLPILAMSARALIASQIRARTEESLSQREAEILNWAAAGKTAKEIGIILKISERTINYHLQSAYRKLSVTNRPHAIARAIETGTLQRTV